MLSSVDWNYTTIDMLLVETAIPQTRRLLTSLGFWNYAEHTQRANVGHGTKELWIHRRVRWGEPGGWHSD